MREEELIAKSLRGEKGAFETLIAQNEKRVRALCFNIVKDEEIAQDLTQETFIKAYRSLPLFEQRAQFSTWVWKIAHNVCLDYLKKQKKEHLLVDQEVPPPSFTERDLEALLEKLPEKQRVVIQLYLIEKLSQKEIAQRLNIPHGTVRSRLFYAKKRLKNDSL